MKKTLKTQKLKNEHRGYASTCNAEIFNYFIHELQLKDTEFGITNKIIYLLPKFKVI